MVVTGGGGVTVMVAVVELSLPAELLARTQYLVVAVRAGVL